MGGFFESHRHKVQKEKKSEPKSSKPKLSYAEKKEYDEIEGKILNVEEEIRQLNLQLEDPSASQAPERLQLLCTEIGLKETQIEQLYIRWEELQRSYCSCGIRSTTGATGTNSLTLGILKPEGKSLFLAGTQVSLRPNIISFPLTIKFPLSTQTSAL